MKERRENKHSSFVSGVTSVRKANCSWAIVLTAAAAAPQSHISKPSSIACRVHQKFKRRIN
jgi:hypothetical protein